jgi:hypothetical protein
VYRALGAAARARGDAEGFVFYEQALELCAAPGTPPIERAATQHEYALLEAGAGRRDSAAARLEEALAIYRRLGTHPEIQRAERDLAALTEGAGAKANPGDHGRNGERRPEQ